MFLWNVLRVYSWIFQTVLCVMAIGVAVAAIVTNSAALQIPWIPMHPENQTGWLLGLGILGLLCVLLAVIGKFRFLLWLFSIHSAYLLIKGLFLNMTFTFSGPDQARDALILCIAAFVASITSFPAGGKRSR